MSENINIVNNNKPAITSLAVIDNALALEAAVSALVVVAELGQQEHADLLLRVDPATAAQISKTWNIHHYLLGQAITRVEAAQRTHKAQLQAIVTNIADKEQIPLA